MTAVDKHILVVDDEQQITRVLRSSLQGSGYRVTLAANGLEGFERFLDVRPDLVITDLSMPEMDGIALTREIRQRAETPILVLSVRDQESMKVAALDEGADDYVTKPFSFQELLARIRVQLRRTERLEPLSAVVKAGPFEINAENHRALFNGEELHLTPKEFDLLLFFAHNPHRVLTHKVLLKAIWGPSVGHPPEYLRVLVAQLRKKIEHSPEPKYIRNEPWIGYRFAPEE